MRTFAALLTFAASAMAYTITGPTNSTGWTITGPNVVSWTRVSTDAANFTIVLSNQASFPPTQQVLDALVDGTQSSIAVNPPSGGWKAGSGFQVNFVANSQELNTILAQSNQFTIKSGTGSSTFSSGTSSASLSSAGSATLTVPNSAVTTGPSSSSGTGTALNPSTSDTSTTTPANAALPALGVQAGLFGLVALVGAFLA